MIAIIADIHGNYPALEAVLEDLPEVKEIWMLGDFVTGVPFPIEVMERLINLPMPVHSVLGNQDEVLLVKRGTKKSRQFGIYEWVEEQLKPHHWEFLEGLPKTLAVGSDVLLYHGTPDNVLGAIITQHDAEQVAAAHSSKWLIGGHRHRPMLFRTGGQNVMIAGSVGVSFDGIGGMASYALLDENTGKFAFRNVSYDVESAVAAIENSPIAELAPGMSNCVKKEILTGKPYMMGLVQFASQYAEKMLGHKPDEIPHEIWSEAELKWDGSEFAPK